MRNHYELDLKEREKLDRFLKLLDDSGVWAELFGAKAKIGAFRGRIPFRKENMFATILYGFCMGDGTLRELESCCRHDLRYIYLMEQERPSYASFCEFTNAFILPNIDRVYAKITGRIATETNTPTETVYLDGTKQEARPNKYKFVFKPTTFHLRVDGKVESLFLAEKISVERAGRAFIKSAYIFEKAGEYAGKNGIDVATLPAKRKRDRSREENIYTSIVAYGNKVLEYEEKEEICGEKRNSFYKTDHDATAMCLKEDYYSGLGGSMHSAYNVQILVSGGLIMSCYVSQSRVDMNDLIDSLEKYHSQYEFYPKNVVADAGYGYLKNYKYMSERGMVAYVKYQNWGGEVSGRRPPFYNAPPSGSIICLNGKKGEKVDIPNRKPRRAGLSFFKVSECKGCPFMTYCHRFMKDKRGSERIFEVDEEFEAFRIKARDLLLSAKGIEMRVNRSCQVEGAFGVIKRNMGYVRFRRISLEKANLEFSLTALGRNIRKYFRFLEGRSTFTYWTAPEGLVAEEMKKPSAKRLCNRVMKIRKKEPNEKAKSEHRSKYKTKKGGVLLRANPPRIS